MAKAEYRSAVRSRKLILAALADLMLEKQMEKITVTDVVNRAQINRGTFYAHYADIPDVIDKLVENAFLRIRDALLGTTCSLQELPAALLRQVQQMLEEEPVLFHKIMTSTASRQMRDQLCSVLLDYMLEHEADFNTGSREDYEFKIRFCAGGLSQLYQDWFSGLLNCSLEELTRRAVDMVLSIIETEKQTGEPVCS